MSNDTKATDIKVAGTTNVVEDTASPVMTPDQAKRGAQSTDQPSKSHTAPNGNVILEAEESELGWNLSYTGADIEAYIILPSTERERAFQDLNGKIIGSDASKDTILSNKVIKLGTLNTFSVSVFRDKPPVRALGSVSPIGHVRGTRTISGTMVFTVLVAGVMDALIESYYNLKDSSAEEQFPWSLSDQLPPFDLLLSLHNESGERSHLILFGVELFSDDITFSINNLVTEQVMRYKSSGYTGLKYDGNARTIYARGATETERNIFRRASDLFRNNTTTNESKNLRNLFENSLDPFI